MSKDITFTNYYNRSTINPPKPAKSLIPEWYKQTNPYLESKTNINNGNPAILTIKKCIPVLDALTAGYMLVTPVDVLITQKEDVDQNNKIVPFYHSSDIIDTISFHSIKQAPLHPAKNENAYPKWMNQWGIETPPGYSCLFINPVHKTQNIFTILEGVVDTDTYTNPVNFPFTLNDQKFEGVIPAGTPMAQVIPFKRESWNSHIVESELSFFDTVVNKKLMSKYFDRYKSLFWHKKEYN
jgi:hypothetical protein